MATGRTLGEAWVTIRPDTGKFRAELSSKVNAAMKGYSKSVNVTVNLNTDAAKLRSQLQTAVTAASRGLRTDAAVGAKVDKSSLAKAEAEIKAASDASSSKAAASYTAWWEKALNKRETSEKAAADRYAAWWDKALGMRTIAERMATSKAAAAEEAATKKSTTNYVNWWSKALDAQELKSRQVTDAMRRDLERVDVSVDHFRRSMESLKAHTDDEQSKAELNVLQSKANVLKSTLGTITTNVGVARALAGMAALNLAAAKFKASMAAKTSSVPGLDLTLAQSQFTHLELQARSLHKDIQNALSPSGITVGKVSHDTMADLTALRGGVEAVASEIGKIKARGGITTADDIARVKTLTSNLGSLSSAVAADGVTVKEATKSWRGWVNALIAIARVQIPLFNGALEKMMPHFLAVASGTHILVEAALEIVAVWVPAAMALSVFGIAATKAALEVASDVRNMGIAASGTGQQFEGMSKRIGKSMSSIAKPYVFEAYGLGLLALQKQSKTTAGVIQSVGGTIDRWFAEAVLAYQKSTGKITTAGAKDFSILGDSFKQLGTLINGFIKITPGYAEDLLKLGDGILHVASAILNSGIAQGFGKIFLSLHGALFYLGLFVTLGTKLGTVLLSPLARITGLSKALGALGIASNGAQGKLGALGASIAAGWNQGLGKATKSVEAAMDDMGNAMVSTMGKSVGATGGKFKGLETAASSSMGRLGGKVATAAKGIKGALSGMLSGLGINPWLLGLAAIGAGLFALVMMFKNSKTAAQAFGDSAKQALSTASLSDFGNTVRVQAQVAQQGLNSAKTAFNSYAAKVGASTKSTQDYAHSLTRMNTIVPGTTAGLASMQSKVKGWQDALDGIQASNRTFNSNLSLIAKTAGVDLPTAMNLANQAGLTTKQLMNDQGVAAQEDALQVKALGLAYGSLVNGVGGVNTAYHAMNIQNSQILKNAQQVAGAFQGYTTLITGGANAFDTFVQGQDTLSKNLQATGKNAGAATLSLGKLKDKISVAGASLDGLSPAAVTANQAFLQQVNNSQALYGSLLQLAAASGNTKVAQNNLASAGKDMIATLLHTAGGSKEAQQQIYSLAQTFGYAGKDTLPDLVKWLGKTGDRTQDLQKRMNGLTAGAGDMANAAKALSGELNNQLGNAMSKSIIDAEGGQAAFDKFAASIRKFASKSNTANYNAMIKAGKQLKDVFIASAGTAAAAEPILANYMMQLGAKNQHQAKQMADQILGIGKATNSTTKVVAANWNTFKGWAVQVKASTDAAGILWTILKNNNFNPLSGHVEENQKKFMDWAHQVGISKDKAATLWNQLLNNKLNVVNGQVNGNKKAFYNLMKQMGETTGEADALWKKLKEAPHVTASVNVKGGVQGQAQAVAQASGAAKQVIGRLFFAGTGQGRAMGGPINTGGGGKIPGWHNTGDNLLAIGPTGPIGLQGGEAIVPKHLATHPEFASFAKKRGIPGFASGGAVPGASKTFDGIANSVYNTRTNMANAGIQMAGDSIQAMKIGAFNAFADAMGGTGGSATGQAILADAEKYRGHKYVWGGPSNPSQGWDCSSFVGYVLGHDFHKALPGGAKWSGTSHGPVASQFNNTPGFHLVGHNVNQIQAGDLLVENSGGHVGFGVGPNKMFSAYGTAFGTIFSDASRMTNIYRTGGAGGGGTVKDIVSKDHLIQPMAKAAQKDYASGSAIKNMISQLNAQYSGNPSLGAIGHVSGNEKSVIDAMLSAMMAPATQANESSMAGWIQKETPWPPIAKYNPMNTTLNEPGASSFNSAGVKNYTSWQEGIAANAQTIVSSGYNSILSDLRAGKGIGPNAASDLLKWSGGGYSSVATGGLIPGFASGGKVKTSPAQKELAKLQHQHDIYAADYHRHIAQMKKDKSKSGKANQKAQADHYAKLISQIDAEIRMDKAAKLKLPATKGASGQVAKLAEKLAAPPWSQRLSSGSYSASPLGWAMQPVLGDIMIAQAMRPQLWAGKSSLDPQAPSVMANWVAAMQSIGGFLNSSAGVNAVQLAGRATGIHGKQTQGPRKSFLTGGTLRENIMGVGTSGDLYKFHSGDKMAGPAVAATQAAQGGLSQEDRNLFIAMLQEMRKANQIAANQGRQTAKAINGNVSRKIGRP